MSGLASRKPAHDDCVGHVLPCGHVHDSADIQHDNQLFALLVERCRDSLDKPHLGVGQQITELVEPVLAFTEYATDGYDGLVGFLCGLLQHGFGRHGLGRTFGIHEPFVELAVDPAGIEPFVSKAVFVEVVCRFVQSESRVGKPLLEVYNV